MVKIRPLDRKTPTSASEAVSKKPSTSIKSVQTNSESQKLGPALTALDPSKLSGATAPVPHWDDNSIETGSTRSSDSHAQSSECVGNLGAALGINLQHNAQLEQNLTLLSGGEAPQPAPPLQLSQEGAEAVREGFERLSEAAASPSSNRSFFLGLPAAESSPLAKQALESTSSGEEELQSASKQGLWADKAAGEKGLGNIKHGSKKAWAGLKSASKSSYEGVKRGAHETAAAVKATGKKVIAQSKAQWKKTQIGTIKLNGKLACEFGGKPLALAPKAVKKNEQVQAMLPEYQGLIQEAHQSTRSYRAKQAKTIGMSMARTLPTAATITLFSTAIGSLIAFLAQKKVAQHHDVDAEHQLEKAEQNYPNLDESMKNLDDLKSTQPELAGHLEDVLGFFDNDTPESQVLHAQLVSDFKEHYNALPPGEREAFLDSFATSMGESVLDQFHDLSNVTTDLVGMQLRGDQAEAILNQALESSEAKARSYLEAEGNDIQLGTRSGAAYGAILGGASSLGLVAFAAIKEQLALRKSKQGDTLKPAWYEKLGSAFGKPEALQGGKVLSAKLRDEAIEARRDSKQKKESVDQFFEGRLRPVCESIL